MTRRELLKTAPALAAAGQLSGQPASAGRLRAGLVAYSFPSLRTGVEAEMTAVLELLGKP